MSNSAPRHIGILLFPGVEELDAVGPWEVLAFWTGQWPDDGWRVCTFSAGGDELRCAKGLRVRPDHAEADRPALDVLVYPGGPGAYQQLDDATHLGWVRAAARHGTLLTSVCTGALVLAAAGLLAGRPATTHWGALDQLGQLDASIEVRGDDRVVDDGDVVTAAGVSAGIDMALHLVARLAGTERAAQVSRGIQYERPGDRQVR